MSTVKILVEHKETGFCKISVDGKYCGSLEDLGDAETSVADVLRKLVEEIPIENTEVIEK